VICIAHESQIGKPTDYHTIGYLGIAKVVKDHSQNMLWAQEHAAVESDELNDISFNNAAEIAASKDERIRHYIVNNFRSSNNRAARHLRCCSYLRWLSYFYPFVFTLMFSGPLLFFHQ
jgi:hypothetical protein